MVTTDKSMQVSQFVRGGRKEVFRAWNDAGCVLKWLYPEECHPISNEMVFCVGGDFRGVIRCGHDTYVAFGTYKQIIPDSKLVFTHQWDEPGSIETEVVVEFADQADGCEVKLTQQGFATDASARGHQVGWSSALRTLARQFS